VWDLLDGIDPRTNQVVTTIRESAPATVVAVVHGVPWVAAANELQRVNPSSGQILQTIRVNANLRRVSQPDLGVAYGDGAFWVIVVADEAQTFGGAVVKVDPATGNTLRTFRVPDPGGYADVQFLDHAIWLKGDDSGRLVKLDDRTGSTTVYHLPNFAEFSGDFPHAIGIGLGDLWVRVNSGLVLRVSPSTGKIIGRYPADPNAGGGWVNIGDRSLWEANFLTDTVWRVRIQ
jgi:streptogramin lyase